MTEPYTTRIAARSYETDFNGHVAGTVLLQYAQHARWECTRAAGLDLNRLLAEGVGPVSLEESIRFRREVRAGDELDVSCTYLWDEGKTFRVAQQLRKSDGTLAAEVTNVGGLLNLDTRRLISEPAGYWRSAATTPALIGL